MPKIIISSVENVLSNTEFLSEKKTSGKLYLKVDSIDSSIVKDIISLLKEYSGETEIIFYDKNSDLRDTLTVTQVQKDAIVISKKNYGSLWV